MKISILIPAHNEELGIEKTVNSCLNQTRPADEIVVVNDGSTDRTPQLLKQYGNKIKVVHTPGLGNKSFAQEEGLKHVTGDIFIATDGDTILDPNFVKYVEEGFQNPDVGAVAGYVRSLPYNWLTACRAFEYAVGQHLHKIAQHYTDSLFVIPGAAGAFRTKLFKTYIPFEHDTLTEDLDFTYRLHRMGHIVHFDRRAIVYTQDPATLKVYVNQMRRWFAGGWQCLMKHWDIMLKKPNMAYELALMYSEGIFFALFVLVLPILSLKLFGLFILAYLGIATAFAILAAYVEKRPWLLLVPIPYLLIAIINSYVFIEQFIKEVIIRKKHLRWYHPDRVAINS